MILNLHSHHLFTDRREVSVCVPDLLERRRSASLPMEAPVPPVPAGLADEEMLPGDTFDYREFACSCFTAEEGDETEGTDRLTRVFSMKEDFNLAMLEGVVFTSTLRAVVDAYWLGRQRGGR